MLISVFDTGDFFILNSLNINLSGSVVVLDEAHNVEDTLKESGSGDYHEFELYQLIAMLSRYSNQRSYGETSEVEMDGENMQRNEVAHKLLLFIEKLVNHMRELRTNFESSPGK